MVTHVIVRSIPGEAYLPGDEVDATLWRNAEKLVGMRYLRPLNKDELRAMPTTRERIAIKAEARELVRLRANAASGDPGAKAELARVEAESLANAAAERAKAEETAMAEAAARARAAEELKASLQALAEAGDAEAKTQLALIEAEEKAAAKAAAEAEAKTAAEEEELKARSKAGDKEARDELRRRRDEAKKAK